MTNQAIIEQLADFGLSPIEARIYMHLIGKAPKSIVIIAKELDLPRTSIYDNTVKLSEKGLIQKIVKHKSQELKAYPLSILQTHIDKEKAKADALQEKLSVLEKTISQKDLSPLATEVRYYNGAKGLQQMIWNTLAAQDELIGYSQFGLVNVVSEKFTEKYANELLQRKLHNRVITNPKFVDAWRLPLEPIAEYRHKFQECRVLDPRDLYVSGDITIYNNVFATAYWDHGEVVGVEIENSEIVKAQRTLFEMAWKQSRPVTLKKKDRSNK